MRKLAREGCSAAFSREAASRRATSRGCRRCWTPRRAWPGRSSGPAWLRQGVPVTFGLVAAGWLTSRDEARAGLDAVGPRLAVQFGGAAGTVASLGEAGQRVAALLAEELGLAVPVLPWHTNRLRIIDLGAALARVTAALGKIARDVTLLAQSEVGEVSEGSASSADGASPAGGGSADARSKDSQAPAESPEHGGVHPPVP